MKRTLLIFIYGIFSMLPFSSAVINCRLACRHCREHNAHPNMLEVYCAMCDECKERQWLQGPPSLNLRNENDKRYSKNYDHEETQDDCSTTTTNDQCEETMLLANKITTSVMTTSTTQRPCTPRADCVETITTKAPCLTMSCPMVAPLAIPLCPMCPMMAMSTVPRSSTVPSLPQIRERKAVDISTTTESMYFYVGVPKRLLNDLKKLRS
ncbi:uncharacterized protein LOC126774348 [Nymphalis io]|uniref:uncharacterized protein LOC126774348 n=1 Tax=Inachis io TaxID=171585 RepID=UPI002168E7C5|nr:uncharacterized protein LOC126774348 [Nymphalis io]